MHMTTPKFVLAHSGPLNRILAIVAWMWILDIFTGIAAICTNIISRLVSQSLEQLHIGLSVCCSKLLLILISFRRPLSEVSAILHACDLSHSTYILHP